MFDESKLATQNGTSATIRIKDWILLDCINFLHLIPILGSIAVLVIYLIIGFGSNSSLSMKNRVLASFIWIIAWLVIGVLFLFVFGGATMVASIVSSR